MGHAGTEPRNSLGSPGQDDIFQLSSGETSLLNLFQVDSARRRFDLSRSPFSGTDDIRGVVVVDEIDLHLHAIHRSRQYEVLPSMIRMEASQRPAIHSDDSFSSDCTCFGITRMKRAQLSEALSTVTVNLSTASIVKRLVPRSLVNLGRPTKPSLKRAREAHFQKTYASQSRVHRLPIVFVEGTTGQRYLRRPRKLLSQEDLLERVEVRDGGGSGDLKKDRSNFKSPLAYRTPLVGQCFQFDLRQVA